MDYLKFAAELSLDKTLTFNSVEENEASMQRLGVKQDMLQIGRGSFRADLAARCETQAELFSDRFNKALSMYLAAPSGSVGLLFPLRASGQFLVAGSNVANDSLIVMPENVGIDIVIPDFSGSEAIAIPFQRYIEMSQILCPSGEILQQPTLIKGNSQQLTFLRNIVVKLVNEMDFQLSDEELSNYLAAVIAWIGDGVLQCKQEILIKKVKLMQTAKLAQEYIQSHYREAVCIEHICQYTCVGIRTLQRCFHGYFQMTISQYLKLVRLNSAKRELSKNTKHETSVTLIGLCNGYTHLGRFSSDFYQQFGLRPIEALSPP